MKQEAKCTKSCKRDCHQVRYTIINSNAKKTLALTNKYKSIISRDLITVSFLWGSFEYVGLEQIWKYSPVQFLSALGGAIGVYLGLSVLTLVVGLFYGTQTGYHYLNGYMENRKRKNGGDTRDSAETPNTTTEKPK